MFWGSRAALCTHPRHDAKVLQALGECGGGIDTRRAGPVLDFLAEMIDQAREFYESYHPSCWASLLSPSAATSTFSSGTTSSLALFLLVFAQETRHPLAAKLHPVLFTNLFEGLLFGRIRRVALESSAMELVMQGAGGESTQSQTQAGALWAGGCHPSVRGENALC